MTLIWATRGRNWGFRFLRDGDFADPLSEYDAAFAGIGAGPSAYYRAGGRSRCAFRIRLDAKTPLAASSRTSSSYSRPCPTRSKRSTTASRKSGGSSPRITRLPGAQIPSERSQSARPRGDFRHRTSCVEP